MPFSALESKVSRKKCTTVCSGCCLSCIFYNKFYSSSVFLVLVVCQSPGSAGRIILRQQELSSLGTPHINSTTVWISETTPSSDLSLSTTSGSLCRRNVKLGNATSRKHSIDILIKREPVNQRQSAIFNWQVSKLNLVLGIHLFSFYQFNWSIIHQIVFSLQALTE